MEYIKKFFNSNLFMIISYLYTVVCWYLKDQRMAIIYYVICAALIIIIDARRTTIATLAFCAIINYRETSFNSNSQDIMFSICLLAPIFIYDVVRSRPKINNSIFMALLGILLASALSLVNVFNDNRMDGLIGVGKVLIYVAIFYFCLIHKEDTDHKYMAKSIVGLGAAILLEYLLYIITYEGTNLWNKDVVLGWGISNSISMMFLITIPITIYVYLENPKHVYLIFLVILEVLSIFLMLCKGAYLALIVLVIPFAIVIYFMIRKGKPRELYLGCIAFICSLLVVAIIYVSGNEEIMAGINKYFDSVINRGGILRDESRILIYQTGLNIFEKYPLFGSGANTANYYLILNDFGDRLKHYHNFAIQALATTGICGGIAISCFGILTLKSCFIKKPYNICVGFVFLALVIHGLVDNTFYNPIIMMVLMFILPALQKKPEIPAEVN